MTREHLISRGIKVIDTSGSGYVHDLSKAMTVPKAEKVFVCPADMPLMTAAGVGNVVSSYRSSSVASFSIAVPEAILKKIGLVPTYTMNIENVPAVLCGVSVVDRQQMISLEYLEQGFLLTDRSDFIVNVNTVEELNIAEKILIEREVGASYFVSSSS